MRHLLNTFSRLRSILVAITTTFLLLSLGFPSFALEGVSPKLAVRAISTFLKFDNAVADSEIVRLSTIAKQPGGTKIVGKELGKLRLPNDVLEDTYLRIAIYHGKLSRPEAEGMLQRLRSTPGFRSTLSKVIGASEVKTSGHLNELRIADNASQHGFQVKGIGVRFDDGMKHGETDIDVLLSRGKSRIAIEAKDYLPSTEIPIDKFRSDFISLAQYSKQQAPLRVITVFSLTNKPHDELILRRLAKEATKNGVELIVGSPEQQIIQINQLQRIL